MAVLGRPVSLNRENIANACLKYYWKQGARNISYNDIIRLTKLSKGSFYKLFKNEDDLQAQTLLIYYNHSNEFLNKINESQDLFKLLSLAKNHKYKYKMSYCYFFSCYAEKYRLGKRTKLVLNDFENKYKLILSKVTKKHIKKNDIKVNSLCIKKLVNYYFNSFITINLLIRNNIKFSEIIMYSNSLLKFTYNLDKKL